MNASQTLAYTTAYDVMKIVYYMAQFDNGFKIMSSHETEHRRCYNILLARQLTAVSIIYVMIQLLSGETTPSNIVCSAE